MPKIQLRVALTCAGREFLQAVPLQLAPLSIHDQHDIDCKLELARFLSEEYVLVLASEFLKGKGIFKVVSHAYMRRYDYKTVTQFRAMDIHSMAQDGLIDFDVYRVEG